MPDLDLIAKLEGYITIFERDLAVVEREVKLVFNSMYGTEESKSYALRKRARLQNQLKSARKQLAQAKGE